MSIKSRNIANRQRRYEEDDDRKKGKRRAPEIRRPTRNWTKAWRDYEATREVEEA